MNQVRKPRKVRPVFALIWMLAAMFCICAGMGRGYSPLLAVSLERGWEYLYPLLREDIYVGLTIGFACLGGLLVYYSVCRPTRAARAVGTALGILYSAAGVFLNIGRSPSPLILFPFLYVLTVWLKNDQLKKEQTPRRYILRVPSAKK